MRGLGRQLCLALLGMLIVSVATTAAELTPREQQMVRVIHATVQQAGSAFAAGEYEGAGKSVREAMRQIGIATQGNSAELYDRLVPAMDRITKAHTMLEFEGVTLPPFRRPERPEADAASMSSGGVASERTGTSATPEAKPMSAPMAASSPMPEPTSTSLISFTERVAPILANRCGRCHITGSKG